MQQPDSSEWRLRNGSRVAFFGGSFDPPHLGHLAVARAARDAFRLDAVLFAPVGTQPLKPEGSSASFDERVSMTRLAIAGEAGFAVSLADAPKPEGEPNYTLGTLKELRLELGADSTLFCLLGADSFFALPRWHRAAEIPFVAPLIVASRPGEPLSEFENALPEGLNVEGIHGNPNGDSSPFGVEVREFSLVNRSGEHAAMYVLPGLHVDISASEIREGIRKGIGARTDHEGGMALLPSSVAEYLRAHGLYR